MHQTVLAAATGNGRALWYLTRGTGAVTLILLTVSVALGIVNVQRWRSPGWPRFVIDALHRNVSLLVMALLGVHVLTAWLDKYAPVGLLDAVIPFHSAYRPIWLGFGALAFDMLVAIVITSLLRARMGQRTWRSVHWLAYASWPVAIVHGLGTGTDAATTWMLALTAGCILVVLAAIASRAATGWPEHRGVRTTAFAALAIGPLALAIWLPRGPLGKGWARRAGTPAQLLASTRSSVSSGARQTTSSAPPPAAAGSLHVPFTAGFSGRLSESSTPDGQVAVDLALALNGPGSRQLRIHLQGPPAAGGGVSMASSQVSLGTAGSPNVYSGSIRQLDGGQIGAVVTRSDGQAVALEIAISVDQAAGQATGTVNAQPLGSGR